jgi:hypothetical protein
MTSATHFILWCLAIFLMLLEALIIYLIATRNIDLKFLISEKDGFASLSRFQLLIFTFLITSLFLILAFAKEGGIGWPDVPDSVLGLLGISGGTYLTSKGIQKTAEHKSEGVSGKEGRWIR